MSPVWDHLAFCPGSTNYPYLNPVASTDGEIILIGGRIDINNPTGGIGGNGILLSHVTFARNSPNTPTLSLSSANGSSYKSFSTTNDTILDDVIDGVTWGQVTVEPLDSD